MKEFLVAVVKGLLGMMLLLWAIEPEGAGSSYERGKIVYSQQCQICHGVKGDGEFAADFTKAKFWQENSVEEMADVIKNGRGPMPAFDLKPDQIQALLDYVSTFRRVEK